MGRFLRIAAGLFVGGLLAAMPAAGPDTWTAMAPAPASFDRGAALAYPGTGDYLYALRGRKSQAFYRYSVSANTWTVLAPAPNTVHHGSALVGTGGSHLYALRANGTGTFWRYSIAANSWSCLASIPETAHHGAALAYPGSGDFIYALRGKNKRDFYRYSISNDCWTELPEFPDEVGHGGSLAYPGTGDFIYGLRGKNSKDFFRYSISGQAWSRLASTPDKVHHVEGALAASGNPDHLYGLRGEHKGDFWRYSIGANAWTSVKPLPVHVHKGGGLAGFPSTSRYVFAIPGHKTPALYRYEAEDAAPPHVTVNQAVGQADPTAGSTIHFTVSFSEAVTGFGPESTDVSISGTAGATTAAVTGGPVTYDVAVSGMTADGSVVISIPAGAATDGDNASLASTSTDNTVTYSTSAPSVTVNQSGSQSDPTAGSPIHFTVSFSEPVTGFDAGDVAVTGTAGATTATVTGGPEAFSVAVAGMTADGTVTVSIPAGAAVNAVGNPSFASSSTDNTVDFDTTGPTVTANQEEDQVDPASTSPIHFTVEFSEPVGGFEPGDVLLAGTAGPTTVEVTGGPTTFDVAVSGMTADGTVTITIPAGVATDLAGNPSTPSTSADDTVTFDATPPAVTINQSAGQEDPTEHPTIHFTAEFTEPVTGFEPGDVTIGGSAGATTVEVTGGPTTYDVAVSGMGDDGTVTVAIPAGAGNDPAGNPNLAAASADAEVTYEGGHGRMQAGYCNYSATAAGSGSPVFLLLAVVFLLASVHRIRTAA